jgi:hypothetical protein
MQCIEHVHAILASKWWRDRFEEGTAGMEMSDHLAELHCLFFQQPSDPESGITPGMVAANVEKLKKLLRKIVEVGTGGYAPPRFT